MFPGFVNTYRDDDNNIHLYFFPGIDENNNRIYNNIDMSSFRASYTMTTNDDNSQDITFDNKNIIKIHTRLIKNLDSSVENKVLEVI